MSHFDHDSNIIDFDFYRRYGVVFFLAEDELHFVTDASQQNDFHVSEI